MERPTVYSSILVALLMLGSCADEGPLTAPDTARAETSTSIPAGSVTPEVEPSASFDCLALEERRVRFTDPGFVAGNGVGLYFLFTTVPAGAATLEIVWDEENEADLVEGISLADYLVNRNGSTTFDYRGLIEHTYTNVTRPVEKQVRATLRLEGYSNDCPTVRRVTVSPPASSSSDTSGSSTRITCRTTSGPLGSNTPPGFPVFIPPGRVLQSRVEFTITPTPPLGSKLDLETFDFFGSRGAGVINNIGSVASFDFALRSSFRPVCGVSGTFDGASCVLYWNCNP